MSESEIVLSRRDEGVLTLTLNRPEVHNALDDRLMRRVLELLAAHRDDREVRAVIFTGAGSSFCAGADLEWMRAALRFTPEEARRDSDLLAELFTTIYEYPKPTLALVNGPAVGGGVGFVAAADVVVAAEEAFFRLSEVRLGLIPACIAPFVLRKTGESRGRELMLTGRRLDAREALAIGLAHRVAPRERLGEAAREYLRFFREAGPQALAWCKEVIARTSAAEPGAVRDYTVDIIARLRLGPEGQEGMAAFLEKRKPSWWPRER